MYSIREKILMMLWFLSLLSLSIVTYAYEPSINESKNLNNAFLFNDFNYKQDYIENIEYIDDIIKSDFFNDIDKIIESKKIVKKENFNNVVYNEMTDPNNVMYNEMTDPNNVMYNEMTDPNNI